MVDNNLDSNITRKLIRSFLNKFESVRVLSKTVNTQMLTGKFDPSSGTTVDFKRPGDFVTIRTATGDISASNKSPIITGKATGTVQNYFTELVTWQSVDEALKLDQLDQLLEPMATRMVTDLETDFASFMLKNAGLSVGSPDTSVTTWQHVATAGAFMKSVGIPQDMAWHYAMNPFTESILANTNVALGSPIMGAVKTALERATLREKFAGMNIESATTLATLTTTAISDRAGSLASAPDATYVTAKDSMTQAWAVTGFTASLEVQAGEILEVTGKFHLNQSTRKAFLDGAGNQVKFRAVVTAPVTLGSSGEGTLVVAGPAIFESGQAFNTVDAALASSDVVTLLGTASTAYQPNLFYHPNAFSIGSVPQQRLFATDSFGQTEDGLQIRVSKFSDGEANVNKIRIDLLPAYSVLNPFFAGQGHA